jgi:hypothetical protein
MAGLKAPQRANDARRGPRKTRAFHLGMCRLIEERYVEGAGFSPARITTETEDAA